jgi:hypothetical protein
MSTASIEETCGAIVALQRARRFAIKSQQRSDRAVESFLAPMLGYRFGMGKQEALAIWKQAGAARRAIEKGDPTIRLAPEVEACRPVVELAYGGRAPWDRHRKTVEEQMQALGALLPPAPFVAGVRGFSTLGLAIVIGETGDLSNYATKERVWKRLGLAVIGGDRQRKKTDPAAAAAHGYSPQRRAEMWALTDSMFRHQWAGDRDADGKAPLKSGKPVAVPAHAVGPYGEVYGRRRAHTAGREWTKSHAHDDARRVMCKALIEDLWRVWQGKNPLAGLHPEQDAT